VPSIGVLSAVMMIPGVFLLFSIREPKPGVYEAPTRLAIGSTLAARTVVKDATD
jgi:hypothetical protein